MRNIFLSAIAIVSLAVLTSCSKDSLSGQESQSQNGPFEVSIKGELGEFAPSTKSTAESCIRMKWENGDVVWAYDDDGSSLGGLTVSVGESDYIAVMTGTLSSAPLEGKLFLVHSPLLSKDTQPSYSDGLTIEMYQQDADVVPFVAYAVVEGVTAAAQSNLKTKFHFATSVLKINATGIAKDAALTGATITNIETACKLTISGGAFTVASEGGELLNKTLSGTASLSRASFYVGVPKFSEGTQRKLIVSAGGKIYCEHNVMQTAYEENNYINYVYEVKTLDYIDEYGVNRGEGTYIETTGVVWAPVNCGYDEDHTYGLLYQWGRKYGQAYEVGTITPETLTKAQGENPAYSSKVGLYYHEDGYFDWHIGRLDCTLWNDSSKGACDPCPTGWRVPTYEELDALTANKVWGSETIGGVSQDGYWFIGDEGNGVFLPAAGGRSSDDGHIYRRGEFGAYWSSSLGGYSIYESYEAWSMGFVKSVVDFDPGHRTYGYSVRCVQE